MDAIHQMSSPLPGDLFCVKLIKNLPVPSACSCQNDICTIQTEHRIPHQRRLLLDKEQQFHILEKVGE